MLAARALALLEDDGQVEVLWERRLSAGGPADRLTAMVTARVGGRGGRAGTEELDDDHLRRAARQASLRARQGRAWPAPPLPEPAEDAVAAAVGDAVLGPDAVAASRDLEAVVGPGVEVALEAGLARRAVTSTAGIRAAEQRSHVVARVVGRRPDGWEASSVVGGAAWGAADGGRVGSDGAVGEAAGGGGAAGAAATAVIGPTQVADAAAEVRALLGEDGPAGPFAVRVDAGVPLLDRTALEPEPVVVLGPSAVATVLEQLRAATGVDAAMGAGPFGAQRGERVAAPGVTLVDDATAPATLGRRFDAEGVGRQRVGLLEDGLVAGRVLDQAAATRAGADSTGHATQALTLAPFPDHLALSPGEADGLEALLEPVGHGLLVPVLPAAFEPGDDGRRHVATGAVLIRDGRPAGRLAPVELEVSALGVLAAVEALTRARQLVPWRGHAPGGIGAATVPALRARGGVRVVA